MHFAVVCASFFLFGSNGSKKRLPFPAPPGSGLRNGSRLTGKRISLQSSQPV